MTIAFLVLLPAVAMCVIAMGYFVRYFVIGRARTYQNDNPKAVKELAAEVSTARSEFLIVSGDPCSIVFQDPAFRKAIAKTRKKHPELKMEAIFGPSPECALEDSPFGSLAKEYKIRVYELGQEPPVHFRIVDGCQPQRARVYIEEHHGRGQENRKIHLMHGAEVGARRLSERFVQMKRRATPVVFC